MTDSKPFWYGTVASAVLLGLYFTILSLVSGWDFAREQFMQFRYFIVALAAGFGVQIGLYARLKGLVRGTGGGAMVGVTGTTSTAAMVSCCAHYLANVLPVLGAVGIVTYVAQYQVELFWVGIVLNLTGMAYIMSRVRAFKLSHAS